MAEKKKNETAGENPAEAAAVQREGAAVPTEVQATVESAATDTAAPTAAQPDAPTYAAPPAAEAPTTTQNPGAEPRRRGALVTTAIVVGGLVVAGGLFGGGVALGANLPGGGHGASQGHFPDRFDGGGPSGPSRDGSGTRGGAEHEGPSGEGGHSDHGGSGNREGRSDQRPSQRGEAPGSLETPSEGTDSN